MKKIILLYLGDFYSDARCINMSLPIIKSNNFQLLDNRYDTLRNT